VFYMELEKTMTYQGKYAAGVSNDAADSQNDARTCATTGTQLTQRRSLSDLRSGLIARRRRARDPVRKARLQLTIDQLGSLVSGHYGPDLPKLIKRQLALLAN
jgi:hypothetical protein